MAESHFSGIAIRKWIRNEKNFLYVPYWESEESHERGDKPQIKFPGGKGKPGETALQTLYREFQEETYLILRASPPRFLCLLPGPSDDPAFEAHNQYFFMAEDSDCMGSMREGLLKGPKSWLGPPGWMPESRLGSVIYHTHLEPLKRARAEP